MKFFKYIFDLDPEKGFVKLPIFWILLVIFVIGFGSISYELITYDGIILDWSYRGFNNFLDVFKLPLRLIVFIASLYAFFIALHKSEQNKRQIEVSISQNNFTNYYKHQEEFMKHCDHILDVYSYSRSSSNFEKVPIRNYGLIINGNQIKNIYNKLFDNSPERVAFSINKIVLNNIVISFENLAFILKDGFYNSSHSELLKEFNNLYNTVNLKYNYFLSYFSSKFSNENKGFVISESIFFFVDICNFAIDFPNYYNNEIFKFYEE